MKKRIRGAVTMAVLLATTFVCGIYSSCFYDFSPPVEFDYNTEFLSETEDPVNGYNSNLFYVNNLEFEIADPTVIQITEGEEKGYFYVYGTSDEIGAHGFQSWRSKDLSHWESMGIALEPDHSVTWASENYWAPEVLYDEEEKLYYLFYNAYNRFDDNHLWLSVAYSEHPAGPFVSPNMRKNANGKTLLESEPVFDVSANNPILAKLEEEGKLKIRTNALDASPFVDPETGEKYMYFGYRNDHAASGYDGTHIYGMKMKDWFSPDYSTITQITYKGYLTVEGGLASDQSQVVNEGNINEGPFMMYHNGNYYMTYSKFGMHEPSYRVMQAIGDAPLGKFTKVDAMDGGTVVSTDTANWNHIVTAGHHCFVKCGNETFIAYHTYKDRNSLAEGRALAVDKVVWIKNSKGQDVMHTNGPTWSIQALPESVSGYKNIAPSAKLTANNTAEFSDAGLLNDEIIKYQEYDIATEYFANKGVSTIKLSWDAFKTVRGIMIYNSYDYFNTFVNVEKVEFEYLKANGFYGKAVINNLPFDWNWHFEPDYEFMRPGGAAIAEFNEMPVKSITITVRSAQGAEYLALGEIVVLGKDQACEGIRDFEEYSYENATYGSAHLLNESTNFGNVSEELKTTYGYDLSNDDKADGYITQSSVGQQVAYFKNVYATDFYVEGEFTITTEEAYLNDVYPKFGIVVASDGKKANKIFYYVDAAGFTLSRVGVAQRKLDGSDWDWKATERLVDVDGMQYTNELYVKLAVLRKGKNFYFLCNDEVVISYNSFNIFDDALKTGVGFMSFNTGLKIKNYAVTTDANVIAQKAENYNISL